MSLAPFQVRSLGILLAGARRTMTAAVTFTTAGGGLPNDLSSVKLACYRHSTYTIDIYNRSGNNMYLHVHIFIVGKQEQAHPVIAKHSQDDKTSKPYAYKDMRYLVTD